MACDSSRSARKVACRIEGIVAPQHKTAKHHAVIRCASQRRGQVQPSHPSDFGVQTCSTARTKSAMCSFRLQTASDSSSTCCTWERCRSGARPCSPRTHRRLPTPRCTDSPPRRTRKLSPCPLTNQSLRSRRIYTWCTSSPHSSRSLAGNGRCTTEATLSRESLQISTAATHEIRMQAHRRMHCNHIQVHHNHNRVRAHHNRIRIRCSRSRRTHCSRSKIRCRRKTRCSCNWCRHLPGPHLPGWSFGFAKKTNCFHHHQGHESPQRLQQAPTVSPKLHSLGIELAITGQSSAQTMATTAERSNARRAPIWNPTFSVDASENMHSPARCLRIAAPPAPASSNSRLPTARATGATLALGPSRHARITL